MLTKELRQEALKKGFHYPKVEKSVEFYRTKNLMIYDFVNENRISMLRVCIAEKKPAYMIHSQKHGRTVCCPLFWVRQASQFRSFLPLHCLLKQKKDYQADMIILTILHCTR